MFVAGWTIRVQWPCSGRPRTVVLMSRSAPVVISVSSVGVAPRPAPRTEPVQPVLSESRVSEHGVIHRLSKRRIGCVTVAQPQSFGSQLRALREAAGLSQEELAERAHISSHAVSALERGTRTRPYPYTIRALADALSVTEDQRASLVAAVPARRPSSREPADAPRPDRAWSLPRPATPLRGRDGDVERIVQLLR